MIVRDVYIEARDPTSDDAQRGGLLWLNLTTGNWFRKIDGGYIAVPTRPEITMDDELAAALAALSDVFATLDHSHPTHGDMELTGDTKISGHLYAEDKRGENATVVIPSVGTLKFKHGIMHEFTPV